MILAPPNPDTSKRMGAYYTDAQIAHFLVNWAVRGPEDRVLDPSFGGGVFLREAAKHIRALGGDASASVLGVELDEQTHRAVSATLRTDGVVPKNLHRGDFFTSAADLAGQVDVVVGNPPFIRYQQFTGELRRRAAQLVKQNGVQLSDLASSWAPFLVVAAGLLRAGGRLAMVAPMELCHASYARPVLEFLARSFSSLQILSFKERLFPELSQDTLLLLADDRASTAGRIYWRHLPHSASLDELSGPRIPRARKLNTDSVIGGRERLIEQFLPSRARSLYGELKTHPRVQTLGTIAEVGIGYVSGANGFFHLSQADIDHWKLPEEFLVETVCRGRAFAGLRFTAQDWRQAFADGDAAMLLALPRQDGLPRAVQHYVAHGEHRGIHNGYKCRTRKPWYHVPHVHIGDAFLTYMSGITPRLVENAAGAVAPNTLHIVRIRPLFGWTADSLAYTWRSTLTELSAEIEGHAMGGGLLKLEPSEAERVLLAAPSSGLDKAFYDELDGIVRSGTPDAIQQVVDGELLRKQLGLSASDCRVLRDGVNVLRRRRLPRG